MTTNSRFPRSGSTPDSLCALGLPYMFPSQSLRIRDPHEQHGPYPCIVVNKYGEPHYSHTRLTYAPASCTTMMWQGRICLRIAGSPPDLPARAHA